MAKTADELLAPFLDRIQDHGPRCGVAVARDRLSGTRREQFDSALSATDATGWTIPGSVIAEVVKDWGVDLNQQSVTRHRAGRCKCQK